MVVVVVVVVSPPLVVAVVGWGVVVGGVLGHAHCGFAACSSASSQTISNFLNPPIARNFKVAIRALAKVFVVTISPHVLVGLREKADMAFWQVG